MKKGKALRVTLVYTGIGICGFNNNLSDDRERYHIGHGLASIGAYAKAAGYDVNLIDLRKLSGWEEFTSKIRTDPADVYGISISQADCKPGAELINKIKEILPDSRIIVGGIHPSVFPFEYADQEVDSVVVGEGEITFVDLLKMIENKLSLPKIIRGSKPNLDEIPWVDRELFDYEEELKCLFSPEQPGPSVTILAGRGCIYKCTYCQPAENKVFGLPYRLRSPQNVIEELKYLQDRYNFKNIIFWDDTFTINKKWIMKFCDLYEAERFGATISACSRADIICDNEPMVERLASIGVNWFVVGLESGSQRLLDFIKKGTTVEQNKESVRISRKYGIKTYATIMYGLPTETREESLATANMINEINPEYTMVFWFFPIPGTEIHKYCVENDLILEGVSDRTIQRTATHKPTLKNIDYDYIYYSLMVPRMQR
jgi:anaerobic magnesium-protoporphyrin IX monomethyl ester cyclase